jgi:hypothetical protein
VARAAHNRKITVRNSRLRHAERPRGQTAERRLSPVRNLMVSLCGFAFLIWGVRQEGKPLDFQSSQRRCEACTPYASWMVAVAQLAERESVALVGAGSSPVSHPESLRSHSSAWSERPVVNRKATGSNPVGSAKADALQPATVAGCKASRLSNNGSVAQLVRASDS